MTVTFLQVGEPGSVGSQVVIEGDCRRVSALRPQAEQAKSRKGPIMTAVCSQCGDRCGRTSAAATPSMWRYSRAPIRNSMTASADPGRCREHDNPRDECGHAGI